jgi:hypothetical protein
MNRAQVFDFILGIPQTEIRIPQSPWAMWNDANIF